MSPLAVDAEALTRSFGELMAVDSLSLGIPTGEVFGLLGPNGAGKTTTIRMLASLLKPTGGSARIFGHDVTREGDEVRRLIGYVTQQLTARYQLTGREAVEIDAALYHVPRKRVRERAREVLELVGLTEHADRPVQEYSGGMKKRLDLACGLLHHPRLLILDEPTLGLDVQARHNIWEHIGILRDRGVTILLATNYLDEADRLCERLMIIDRGREIVTGTPAELKRAVGADAIEIETNAPQAVVETVDGKEWVRRVATTNSTVHVYVDDASVAMPTLMRDCLDRGIELQRVTYSEPSLDDVLLLHTGRELRENGR